MLLAEVWGYNTSMTTHVSRPTFTAFAGRLKLTLPARVFW